VAIQDLTQGSVSRQLTRMTIPFFLGMSSMILGTVIETIYIGLLGAKELAAASFMFPIIMALTSISMGVGTGASSVIARAEGTGNREQVKRYVTHTVFLTTALTLFLGGAAYFLFEDLYSLIGAEGEVLVLVVDFSQVWVVGLITFTLPMVASSVLRALGIAKAPGYIMAATSGMQLVVSPIFMFGLFGVPAYGFVGSAYGFILVGIFRLVAFAFLVWRERIVLYSGATKDFLKSVRTILRIALPSMLSALIGPLSMAITIVLLAAHGDLIVAGYGIVSRIEMMVTMLLGALAASVAPFVGQNWGARKIDRIYRVLSVSHRFCLGWGLICFALLAPFGDNLVSLINDEPELVTAASWFFLIVPASFGVMGAGQVSASLFIALGKPIPPTILSVLRTTVVYIPMAILFDHLWGYVGIFAAALVANVLYGFAAYLWGRSMFSYEVKKVEPVSAVTL
jgi:putative MATE family efflux protein